MQQVDWYYHRLRSMGPRELIWRLRNTAARAADSIRIPLGLVPTSAHLEASEKSFNELDFGFSFRDDLPIWDSTKEPFISWEKRLVTKANHICSDELTFFGLEKARYGHPIDWQLDIASGKSAGLRQSVFIDYRDFKSVGDCKLVWEPNRHHQLVVLARAYFVTRDRTYARKIIDLLTDWMQANPFGYGMNWKSPLELGIRMINWIWSLELIRDSGVIDDHVWEKILNCVYLSVWSVQRQYSKGSSANNHLIGEAAGVFITTSYFEFFKQSTAWRNESKKILEREIENQFFSDGCTREHAFGYQLFVLQFLTVSALVARWRQEPFSDRFMQLLRKAYGFVAELSADTGVIPRMGDSDDGYVLDLGNLPTQSDELIEVGAHMFGDGSLRRASNSETLYWLLGKSKVLPVDGDTEKKSVAFQESGYFILRSGCGRESPARPISVLFDCAELGYGSIAAHGHADCLGVLLNVGSHEIFVDSGTFDYFSYPRWRKYFRSTQAHNTVTVDDLCQSESRGLFLWGRRANATIVAWQDSDNETVVVAEHDGYSNLPDPVLHKRAVRLLKSDGLLEILDTIDCAESHKIDRYFHLSPECQVLDCKDSSIRIENAGIVLELSATSGVIEIIEADDAGFLGWVSTAYHVKKKSLCIVLSENVHGSTTLTTRIRVID